MAEIENQPEQLTRAEAADFCQQQGYPVKKSLLNRLAVEGGGPPFKKFRNKTALYAKTDLLSWIQSQLSATTTSTSQTA